MHFRHKNHDFFSESVVAMIGHRTGPFDRLSEKVFSMIILHRSARKLPSSELRESSEATDVRGGGGVDRVRED